MKGVQGLRVCGVKGITGRRMKPSPNKQVLCTYELVEIYLIKTGQNNQSVFSIINAV